MQSYVFFRNQTTFATILPQISISGGALVSARLCRLPEQEVHQPSKQWSLPQIAQIYTELLAEWSLPQIARICTELLAECILPQISQIYTEAANFRGCTCLRSALPLARARSAPTKQTVVLPQIARICTELLAEWSLPQIAQIYTEAANFRGCTCLKCTNRARSAPTEQYRYTSCYVGALETSAPPDISSEFCAICGRIFAPKQSV